MAAPLDGAIDVGELMFSAKTAEFKTETKGPTSCNVPSAAMPAPPTT